MAANEDLLFVELALKRELVTQEEVDEILAVKEKLAEMGLADSVADLMVKKGVLSESDAEAVRAKVSPKGGRQQIKGYRLLERLGRGGMGSVYKAVQLSMDRTVALKVLKPSLVEDDQSTSRLRREAQLVGQLRHPNIVQGLDFGVSNGFHYFAMEYVDGESVRQILGRDKRMKEADALRVVTDVAKALEHAHQEGVVHRDVKPGNILVARDGASMLADYGLAKGPLEDAELTRSGVTVGTPQYISPEQAQGPKDVDIRTDVYSLGATLYHMLTGRPPYEGETLAHLIQQVLYEEYAPVRALRRDISPDVAYLVAKMMARKPSHRYQSPKALLKDLKAIEDGRSIIPAGWAGSIEALAVRRR
ncbi:MAG: serine/threonine-protein kinase, partial [Planctomycetota bacterium]